jgi:SAM-dependent methyltransferase
VLELGCGMGRFTRFLRNREYVLATDNDHHQLAMLRRSLELFDNIECRPIDWQDPDAESLRAGQFDTILCLDALERIEQDEHAMATFADLLTPGGRLVLHVPAVSRVYGESDRAMGHFRRYDRDELASRLAAHGFTVEQAAYVNVPGLALWYLNSRLLRRRAASALAMRLANAGVPWLRLEARCKPRVGLSLIVAARKTADVTGRGTRPFVVGDPQHGLDPQPKR